MFEFVLRNSFSITVVIIATKEILIILKVVKYDLNYSLSEPYICRESKENQWLFLTSSDDVPHTH
jgi:hypothetical protein